MTRRAAPHFHLKQAITGSGITIMYRALLLLLPFLVPGCVSSERTYLPNGMAVNRISCTLAIDSLSRCYKAAGDMCGSRGYTVYDWDGTPWPKPYPDPSSVDSDTMLGAATLLTACHAKPVAN